MAYDFHYTPTGTGVISGKEVLEQTEDAINDLGNTAISGVQEALDKAEQALTNSENAVDDAQTALNTANNAEGVAIQAQTDVGNLSGTVANIGNRVTTAEGNISNLQGRMTTAEGKITNLQGRMTTAETNIGNLQTAVSTAQATANSAQQTATTARQQSYVFRYSGTAITDNSTIAYSTIDNTDNIKSGDKILDVDGKLFEITAVDTTNQTVTVGSALVDLALDANVVHTSGNETIGGSKTFSDNLTIYNSDNTVTPKGLIIRNAQWSMGESGGTTVSNINFLDKDSSIPASVMASKGLYGQTFLRFSVRTKDSQNTNYAEEIYYVVDTSGNVDFRPWHDNVISLGTSAYKWKDVQTKLIKGLTPSSLSMPSDRSARVDISGYFTNTGTGEFNTYPVTANGWIFLRLSTISSCQVSVLDSNSNLLYGTTSSGGIEQILVPVIAGTTFKTQWSTASTVVINNAYFIPCQGNI